MLTTTINVTGARAFSLARSRPPHIHRPSRAWMRDQSRALVYALYESGHVGRPHHVDSQSPSVRQSQTHICAALRSQYIHTKKILRPAGHLTGQAIGKPPGPPDGQSGPDSNDYNHSVGTCYNFKGEWLNMLKRPTSRGYCCVLTRVTQTNDGNWNGVFLIL